VPEYGSAEDAKQFEFLHAYSPYHHVEPGVRYPAVLLTAGENDTRVHALHARKMAAKLQAVNADPAGRPVLLWVDREAGHGQGKPLNLRLRDVVDQRIFLMWQLACCRRRSRPGPLRGSPAPELPELLLGQLLLDRGRARGLRVLAQLAGQRAHQVRALGREVARGERIGGEVVELGPVEGGAGELDDRQRSSAPRPSSRGRSQPSAVSVTRRLPPGGSGIR